MTPWRPDRPVAVLHEPRRGSSGRRQAEDEWLWGWDATQGIVSVWAEGDGRTLVWRRIAKTGELVCEGEHYRPWMLLDRLDDLRHLGERLAPEGTPALLGYDGALQPRGVAFRSSRAEPFGKAFLRRAIDRLLAGDAGGVREVYLATLAALRRRELPIYDVSSKVRLTKTPASYLATCNSRRELPYEVLLASGRTFWSLGDRVRVYRTKSRRSDR